MFPPWPLDGPSLIDRASDRRRSVDVEASDVVVVSGGAVLMDEGHVLLVSALDRPVAPKVFFLGSVEGRDVAVVGIRPGDERSSVGQLVPLREALALLGGEPDRVAERELAVLAVAMVEWHERNAFCPRCGGRTEPGNAGWVRLCAEGHEHYPRTDPAVIVAITDEADRLLLAHVAYHSLGRYSHLAGYVEPGESLEQAVHREVREEASLRLEGLEYVGSQPWPFPASIMVGYRARAASGDLKVDGVEVTDALWVTREELRERLGSGETRLASPGTIARTLIHEWYGGDPVRDAGVAEA